MKDFFEIIDHKIDNKEDIYKEVSSLPYFFGEKDNANDEPTGLTSELKKESISFQSIYNFISQHPLLKDKEIHRTYVNLFIPRENANYHPDGLSGYTLLYYANLDYDYNEGGETKFLQENNTVFSVLPVPGRIVVFSAKYIHSASSYKNKHRFSIAFKFKE